MSPYLVAIREPVGRGEIGQIRDCRAMPQSWTSRRNRSPIGRSYKSPFSCGDESEVAGFRRSFRCAKFAFADRDADMAERINPTFSLFRLFPPNVLPFQVKPVVLAVRFPHQFEVRSVLQMGFLHDKPLILAMDQRSKQSSDSNAGISAELLDKHNRLWTLDPIAASPVLYRPDLFPQSVLAFLLQNDRLWVVGDVTGYLDLVSNRFYKFGLANGLGIQRSEALCAADGRIFAAGEDFAISAFTPSSGHWTSVRLPQGRLGGTGSPSLLAGGKESLCYVAGNGYVRNLEQGSWTAVPELGSVQAITYNDEGFWLGSRDGLHIYNPTKKSRSDWLAPKTIQGIRNPRMEVSFGGGPTIRQGTLERLNETVERAMEKVEKERARMHASKGLSQDTIDPLGLNWRIPGAVTALADDGEFLWAGFGNFFGDCLVLFHKPSRSLVGYFATPTRDAISSIAVSSTNVWIGTSYGDDQLLCVPKEPFQSVPRSRWASLAISPKERARLIGQMSTHDQAVYAFYAADDARVVQLLGNTDPVNTSLEEMFLLAFSYDASGVDDLERCRAWFGRICSRYPNSPWANIAQTALAENERQHRAKAHTESLPDSYDRNHDGSLDAKEKRTMQNDPAYQRQEENWKTTQLEDQIERILQRYDSDQNGRLDRTELERLRIHVRLYSEAPAQMLAGRKILVAPLMIKNFPTVSAILQRHDANHDGALNKGELNDFALSIQKKR